MSEPEQARHSVSSIRLELVGTTRSGRQRFIPEESDQTGLVTGPVLAQRISSAEVQQSLLPGTADQVEAASDSTTEVISAGQSASRNLAETGGQVGAGGCHQEGEVVRQLTQDSDPNLTEINIRMNSDTDTEKGDQDEEARAAAAAAAKAAEAARDSLEVQIIEPSPTGFNPSKMPKTIKSHVFICAKQATLSDRVRVMTSLEECDDKVKELEELEVGRVKDDSED